ncbi:MAG: ABC transporter ATP-binding protein [Candidatus Njordarchaeales archaeon]
MAEILRLNNVSFRYMYRKEYALREINLGVREGEIVLLAGRSGSGKSSLIRVINGLIPFFYEGSFAGQIILSGEDITDFSPRNRLRKGIATVSQFPEDQILARKVWRAVAFGLANLGFSREEIIKRVREALKFVDMWEYWDRETLSLSAGQKQKVVLAAALALQPKVLLLDEPTSQLDPLSAQKFLLSLSIIRDELDVTIIVAEHRFDELTMIADKVVLIENGEVIAEGPPKHIFASNIPKEIGIGYPKLAMLSRILFSDNEIVLSVSEFRKKLDEKKCKVFRTYSVPKVSDVLRNSSDAVVLEDVWFAYDKEWILKNVSFRIGEGAFVAIVGPNGAGKTTLLKLISGIHKPVKGRVLIYGKDSRKLKLNELIGLVGYMPQNPEEIFFNDTVFDEIAFALRMQRVPLEKIKERVLEIAKLLGISHLLKESPFNISGGEKLRVALASILVLDPKILLLDEPTRGIDWNTKYTFFSKIREVLSSKTIILATHDIELLAELPIDKIVLVSEGEIVKEGDKRILADSVIENHKLVRPKIAHLMDMLGVRGVVSIEEAAKIIRCVEWSYQR